jgi:hypothetical protein
MDSKSRTEALAEEVRAKTEVSSTRVDAVRQKKVGSGATIGSSAEQTVVLESPDKDSGVPTNRAHTIVQEKEQVLAREGAEKLELPVRKIDSPAQETEETSPK